MIQKTKEPARYDFKKMTAKEQHRGIRPAEGIAETKRSAGAAFATRYARLQTMKILL